SGYFARPAALGQADDLGRLSARGGGNYAAQRFGGLSLGLLQNTRITLGRLEIAVAQHGAHDREVFGRLENVGRSRVAQVVDENARQTRAFKRRCASSPGAGPEPRARPRTHTRSPGACSRRSPARGRPHRAPVRPGARAWPWCSLVFDPVSFL